MELPRIVAHLIRQPGVAGPVNAAAPNPVTNRELTAALAAMLRRPALLPVPSVILRTLLGELAQEVLGGVAVPPRRLLASGYVFRYPTIDSALRELWDTRRFTQVAAAQADRGKAA